MGKIRTRKILFVVAAMLLCVLVAVLIRLFFSNRIVRMTLTPIEVEVGEAVHYADSTRNASSWLWEFGNGDVSHERSGQYVFKEPGRYQVRLQVDHSLEKKQIVKVNRRANNYGSDQLVKIEAPATAFQGEIISFKGYGPSREWRWQFGESGIVDSREQNPLYAYSEAGRYEVLLTTEETQYPVRHTIEVLPQYAENDSTDVLVVIGNDIREHLQAIVDGKPFNVHYNYILKKYLCVLQYFKGVKCCKYELTPILKAMGKQIAKLGIRPEDLKDKTVTSEQLEKTKGGKAAGSEECVCYCGCYTDDSAFGVDFNWWSRDWD